MRTTIDLPEDLHRSVQALARDAGQSMSAMTVALLRRGLAAEPVAERALDVRVDPVTGLSVIHGGAPVTADDVRRLQDAW